MWSGDRGAAAAARETTIWANGKEGRGEGKGMRSKTGPLCKEALGALQLATFVALAKAKFGPATTPRFLEITDERGGSTTVIFALNLKIP